LFGINSLINKLEINCVDCVEFIELRCGMFRINSFICSELKLNMFRNNLTWLALFPPDRFNADLRNATTKKSDLEFYFKCAVRKHLHEIKHK
jgi:hypothetical protein